MGQKEKTVKEKTREAHRALSVAGLILCLVFGFLLICNITIIVKGTLHPEQPPSVLGTTPMVVLSGSMSGTAEDHIEAGDLIFVGKTAPEELEKGDVIAFMENEGSTAVITHRIIDIDKDSEGNLEFYTKGDANNAADQTPVSEKQLVGIYKSRIPRVGDFALFLHEPLGMAIFIGIPLIAFIIYDVIRRQSYAKKENRNAAEMQAEIERLRTLAGENQNDSKNL